MQWCIAKQCRTRFKFSINPSVKLNPLFNFCPNLGFSASALLAQRNFKNSQFLRAKLGTFKTKQIHNISNLNLLTCLKEIGFFFFFCLKCTLVQPKAVAGVSPCDTEGPWKVWGKTDSLFPIQLRKKCANFIEVSEMGQISKFISWFYLKGTLF